MQRAGKFISLTGLLVFSLSTTTTIVGQEIGVGLMFIGWLILWRNRAAPGMRTISLELPLIALGVAWGFSTFFAAEPLASLVNMKKLILIPIVYGFAWLIRDEKTLKTLIFVMLAVAFVVSLYGVVGYTRGYGLEESYRVRATLSSTVTLAGVMLFVFAISLSLTLFAVTNRARVLLGAVTVLSFICLILTFTRGAWLGALLAFLVTLMLTSGRRRLVLFCAIFLFAATPLVSQKVRDRVHSLTQVQEMSISGRFSMWLSATEMAKDHPLFGVGLMDLNEVYDSYRRPDSRFSSGHMHSNFFHVAASTGLVGLFAFLWFLRSICTLMLRNFLSIGERKAFLSAVCLGSLAGFCAFVAAGTFEWNFGDAEVVSMLYCVTGLTCACERIHSSAEKAGGTALATGS